MANIISDVMGMATPSVVDKIASSLGVSGTAVNGIMASAVPGILGALANKGSTPGGAKDILAQFSNLNPSMLASMGGANTAGLATQGTSMLTSLLGHGGLSTLTSAITGGAGVPAAAGTSLMGLAAQMVMGGLAKNVAGMDGAGLSNFLASQKGVIQAALPSGVADVLGMAGGAGAMSAGATRMASSATSAASSAASNMGTAARNTASQAQASMNDTASSGMGWLKYAIPALIVLGGIWWFAGHRNDTDDKMAAKPAATAAAPAAPAAPAAAGSMMVGDVDVAKNLTSALGDLTGALSGVTDLASAQAALPKLQGAGTAISAVSAVAAKFSPEQKTAVAGLVNSTMPGLTALVTKVEGNADVAGALKPALDGILASLTGLAK